MKLLRPITRYMRGDVVAFVVGGFGQVDEAIVSSDGITSYSTTRIDMLPDHPEAKRAWFEESEILRRIA